MGPAIGAGAGVLLGAIKHNQDLAKYNRDKELAAQMEAWSPWTGVHGQMPSSPGSQFGDMMQGGISGATMGANTSSWLGSQKKPKTEVAAESAPSTSASTPTLFGSVNMFPQAPNPWLVDYTNPEK